MIDFLSIVFTSHTNLKIVCYKTLKNVVKMSYNLLFTFYIDVIQVSIVKDMFEVIGRGIDTKFFNDLSKPKFNFRMSDFSHQSFLKSNIFKTMVLFNILKITKVPNSPKNN